jgi:hypothetical protein
MRDWLRDDWEWVRRGIGAFEIGLGTGTAKTL